jgi:hypothetical protein
LVEKRLPVVTVGVKLRSDRAQAVVTAPELLTLLVLALPMLSIQLAWAIAHIDH